MSNLTGAFSIYEVLRILMPGLYLTSMLKILYTAVFSSSGPPKDNFESNTFFFTIVILLGAALYAIDVPRWFKKLYASLPSNLIEKNKNKLSITLKDSKRPYEDIYFEFYYQRETKEIFKTEIQSGFFHYFMTMTFISFSLLLIHCVIMSFGNKAIYNYSLINIFIFIISLLGAFAIYKIKLSHSWNRDYLEFVKWIPKSKLDDKGNPPIISQKVEEN